MNKGKVIHHWTYTRNKEAIRIPVRLIVIGPNSTAFAAQVPEFNIKVQSDDIDVLKREVFSQLDKRTEIAWEEFIYLEVAGLARGFTTNHKQRDGNFSSARIEISISAEPLELGKAKAQKVHRKWSETWTRDGWPEIGADTGYDHGEHNYSPDEMRSLIPDTPANRAAIESIAVEFSKIIKRLHDLFAPRAVQQTIEHVRQRGLLSPPKDETENAKSKPAASRKSKPRR